MHEISREFDRSRSTSFMSWIMTTESWGRCEGKIFRIIVVQGGDKNSKQATKSLPVFSPLADACQQKSPTFGSLLVPGRIIQMSSHLLLTVTQVFNHVAE